MGLQTRRGLDLLTAEKGGLYLFLGFPVGSEVKASAWNVGDQGSIPGSGKSPGEGNGDPLQYSCLENSMNGGTWQTIVYGVAKSQMRLKKFYFSSNT